MPIRPYAVNDLGNCAACRPREPLVFDQRRVGRPHNSPMGAVRRELRELVLSSRPTSHLADGRAQDRERLAVERPESFRLVENRRKL